MTKKDKLQQQCDEWNALHPEGTPVRTDMDSGEVRTTTTKSRAQVLNGQEAVIWLDGIRGLYLLDRVTAISAPSAT